MDTELEAQILQISSALEKAKVENPEAFAAAHAKVMGHLEEINKVLQGA